MMRPALFAVACLLPVSAQAQDRQYRQLTLIDGRVLTAEILATESTGLRLRVPQGEMLVSFEVLLDMAPAEQSAYEGQTDWFVYVMLPDAHQEAFLSLVDAIPGVAAYQIRDEAGLIPGGVTTGEAFEAASCDGDLDCVITALASTPLKWILVADDQDGELEIRSKVNTSGSPPDRVRANSSDRDDLWQAAHTVLGLDSPSSPPPRVGKGGAASASGGGGDWDEGRVLASSFVPLPGYPSLAQGDGSGVALALGLVVPTTAIWVGAVGQSGQSVGEFAAMSVAGFYVSTVLVNQVTGMRSLGKRPISISVASATQGRGGTVTIGGPL